MEHHTHDLLQKRWSVKYINITNQGLLNRKFLELIGFTTKRERVKDTSVIGNKGSGTKLSAVAALRLDLDLTISSTDYLGRYFLKFGFDEVDIGGTKAKQIIFRYSSIDTAGNPVVTLQPWCMTLDAFQDWDVQIGDDDKSAFKVIREFICNALDEDRDFSISLVDTPGFAEEGKTSVFLRYTDEIRQIFMESERYFKFLPSLASGSRPKPVIVIPGIGEAYRKSDPSRTRMFVQGVLVECSSDYWLRSVFDYSLFEKTLISEERIIKNLISYLRELGRLLVSVSDIDMATMLLGCALEKEGVLERRALSQTTVRLSMDQIVVWAEAAHRCLGENICITSRNAQIDGNAEQRFGYKVVTPPDQLWMFLESLGIPNARAVVPENPKYEFVHYTNLDEGSRERLHKAHVMLTCYFGKRADFPVVLYHPLDEDTRKIRGFTRGKFIWLGSVSRTELPGEEDIFKTLLHESRHIATQAGDYDRAFVNAADVDVSSILYGGTTKDKLALIFRSQRIFSPRLKIVIPRSKT